MHLLFLKKKHLLYFKQRKKKAKVTSLVKNVELVLMFVV